MSLEQWIEDAKEDGIVQDTESSNQPSEKESDTMEKPIVGSSPIRKENKTIIDTEGYSWLVTPRGFRYPLPRKCQRDAKNKAWVKLPQGFHWYERFGREHPCVQQWLETIRSKGTRGYYAKSLLRFCVAVDKSPKEFGDLSKTIEGQRQASAMATKYIMPLVTSKPWEATKATAALRSFFDSYSGGFVLPLNLKKLKPRSEDKTPFDRTKFYYGTNDEMRQYMERFISMGSRDLRDRMALTILFRAGLRSNTLNHFKVKHVQDIIEVEHPKTKEVEELLCLTITGYSEKTDEGICKKTAHYEFPPLIDSPGNPKGYYTYLAGDSLELFKVFMATYHKNSQPNDHLFTAKEGGVFATGLRLRFKGRIVPKGAYPEQGTPKDPNLIRLHDFRWIFGELAAEILKRDKAEMLAGHKLPGQLEHYRKRGKISCAQDYLKIVFSPSIELMKEKWLEDLKTEKIKEEEKVAKAIEPTKPTPTPTTPLQEIKERIHEKMEPIIEIMIGPAPKKCMRNLDFRQATDDKFCHTACAQTKPTEYQACQQAKKENPELFT